MVNSRLYQGIRNFLILRMGFVRHEVPHIKKRGRPGDRPDFHYMDIGLAPRRYTGGFTEFREGALESTEMDFWQYVFIFEVVSFIRRENIFVFDKYRSSSVSGKIKTDDKSHP